MNAFYSQPRSKFAISAFSRKKRIWSSFSPDKVSGVWSGLWSGVWSGIGCAVEWSGVEFGVECGVECGVCSVEFGVCSGMEWSGVAWSGVLSVDWSVE